MAGVTQHCHKCGWEWTLNRSPGRSETCLECQADLKVCLNCAHYDRSVAYQCRERRAEPVEDKAAANFCEYFEMARREFVPTGGNPRQDKARDVLKKLLGD
jgi:ribosome-binding protein aMBF1 (putative translation factor)